MYIIVLLLLEIVALRSFLSHCSSKDGSGKLTTTLEFINFKGSPSNSYEDSDGVYGVVYRPRHFVDNDKNIYSFDSAFGASIDSFGRTITRPTLYPVSYFEHEFDINETNRTISLPSKNMVEQMENELRKILKG